MITPRVHNERLTTAIANCFGEIVARIGTTEKPCSAALAGLTAYAIPKDLDFAQDALSNTLPIRTDLPLVLDPRKVAPDMHVHYARFLSSLILGSMVEFDGDCYPLRLEFDFDENFIGVASITWGHHIPPTQGKQNVGSDPGS